MGDEGAGATLRSLRRIARKGYSAPFSNNMAKIGVAIATIRVALVVVDRAFAPLGNMLC